MVNRYYFYCVDKDFGPPKRLQALCDGQNFRYDVLDS